MLWTIALDRNKLFLVPRTFFRRPSAVFFSPVRYTTGLRPGGAVFLPCAPNTHISPTFRGWELGGWGVIRCLPPSRKMRLTFLQHIPPKYPIDRHPTVWHFCFTEPRENSCFGWFSVFGAAARGGGWVFRWLPPSRNVRHILLDRYVT